MHFLFIHSVTVLFLYCCICCLPIDHTQINIHTYTISSLPWLKHPAVSHTNIVWLPWLWMVVAVVTAVAVIVAVTVTVVVVVVTAAQSLASYYCGCHATQSLAPAARREFLFVLRAFASFPFFCFFHLPSSVSLFLFLRFFICPPSTLAGFLYLLPVPRGPICLSLPPPAESFSFLFSVCFCFFILFSLVYFCLCIICFICPPPCPHAGFLYLLPVPRARPNLPLTPATRREFLFVLRLLLFLYFVFVFGALRLCIFVCAFFVFVRPLRALSARRFPLPPPRSARPNLPLAPTTRHPPRVSLCSPFDSVSLFCFRGPSFVYFCLCIFCICSPFTPCPHAGFLYLLSVPRGPISCSLRQAAESFSLFSGCFFFFLASCSF